MLNNNEVQNQIKEYVHIEEIDRVIMAHQMWKAKIRKYITNDEKSINLRNLKQDGNCDFSIWLNSLPEKILIGSNLKHFNKIKKLHSKFHEVANVTVELILSGNEHKAKGSIEHGDFLNVSTRLILALLEWKPYIYPEKFLYND